MPNRPDDYSELFDGADAPRPLPDAVRDRLEASLSGPLADADRPRPLPTPLRDRLERTLVPASIAPRLDRRMRVAAVAAVLALLAGTIAVLGQAGGRGGSSERALVRDDAARTVPELGTSTTSSTVAVTATTGDPTVVGVAGSEAVKLQTFSSCPELLEWTKTNVGSRVTEYGIGASGGGDARPGVALPRTDAADSAQPQAGAMVAEGSRSATNVQEAGVDEPDHVKTDGQRLYVSRYQSIVAIDVSGPSPVVAGTLEFPNEGVRGLLLDGTTLVAIVDSGQQTPKTRLLAIDAPTLKPIEERIVEGSLVDARLTGGRVHAVVVDQPQFNFTYPQDGSPQQAAAAKAANQRVIAESTAADWVPDGVACDDVRHPPVYSGPTTTTLYSFSPRNPAASTEASVLANTSMLYASQDSLYVATANYDEMVVAMDQNVAPPTTLRTSIHRFSLGATPRYLASGSVDGYLHSQWALSERDGVLRVASTSAPPWRGGEIPSESSVTVLATQGDQLVPIGHVGGLGQGEQIQGVRFVDDVGFVVTFRQVDPLYTIDLSNPAAPRVRGELKVPGFSAYLHPVPPSTLLGIGPDGDAEGRRKGESVSLYDISNLDKPTLRQRLALGGESSYSPVESDHRAFLWYPQDSLAALPIYDYNANSSYASVLTVTTAGVGERGRVTHDKRISNFEMMPIDRLVIVGDTLYSFSYAGVLASDLATLADRGFVALPVEPNPPIPVDS